jgi:hypothetical protein
MEKWVTTHQEWYACVYESILQSHIGSKPTLQNAHGKIEIV